MNYANRRGNFMTALPKMHRFWLKVWPRGDCWEWRGDKSNAGYGAFSLHGERFKAHRIAYEEAKGIIPVGLQLDHLCRHPWCVKPSHLEAVTARENLLRGDTGNARNAKKTHCIRGHELPASRACPVCKKMHWRKTYDKYKAIHGHTYKYKRKSRHESST